MAEEEERQGSYGRVSHHRFTGEVLPSRVSHSCTGRETEVEKRSGVRTGNGFRVTPQLKKKRTDEIFSVATLEGAQRF